MLAAWQGDTRKARPAPVCSLEPMLDSVRFESVLHLYIGSGGDSKTWRRTLAVHLLRGLFLSGRTNRFGCWVTRMGRQDFAAFV